MTPKRPTLTQLRLHMVIMLLCANSPIMSTVYFRSCSIVRSVGYAECAGFHCVTDDKERALRNRHYCFRIEQNYVNRFVLLLRCFPSTASIPYVLCVHSRTVQLKTNT